MADKVVQLKDKNGNNLYPISSVPNTAKITMTNVDPGEGSSLAADNFIAVYGATPLEFDYSFDEVDTGAKWIDGKAIYKKTINFGVLPNNTSKTVNHGISNLSRVIKLEGYAFRPSEGTIFPIPFASENGAAYAIGITTNSTVISIGAGIDRSNLNECYITLYYTKTS